MWSDQSSQLLCAVRKRPVCRVETNSSLDRAADWNLPCLAAGITALCQAGCPELCVRAPEVWWVLLHLVTGRVVGQGVLWGVLWGV